MDWDEFLVVRGHVRYEFKVLKVMESMVFLVRYVHSLNLFQVMNFGLESVYLHVVALHRNTSYKSSFNDSRSLVFKYIV